MGGEGGGRCRAAGSGEEVLTFYWAQGLVRLGQTGVLRVEALAESALLVGDAGNAHGIVVTWLPAPNRTPSPDPPTSRSTKRTTEFQPIFAELSKGTFFGMAVDEVDSLLSELCPDGIIGYWVCSITSHPYFCGPAGEEGFERLAVCPTCLYIANHNATSFPVEALARLALTGFP